MSMYQDAHLLGGSQKRQPDATHVVSVWHIPGGTDYDHATAIIYYFVTEVGAQSFARKYKDLPEMSMLMTITEFDVCVAKAQKATA